jgi:hypothetical protein
MAYSTSSVSNIADLLTFIRNACTANGWTLAGNVLYRGNCYVEIIADGSIGLRIRGGTGIDGSNNLTGACPQYAWIGTIAGVPLAYPLTAEAHINTAPDEVYIVINYSTSYYSLLAWGMSDAPGLTGSGVWFHANRTTNQGTREYHSDPSGIGISINFGTHVDGAPMFSVYDGSEGTNSGGTNNSFVHHDLDGAGWSSGDDVYPSAFRYLAPLYQIQPNAWNGEAVLLPYSVYFPRPSSKHSLVADFKHVRLVRINFLQPKDTITLGPDRWRVYPFFRKEVATPNGGPGVTHSGTLGYAVRYTGP